ncbi:MAG TPA: divalent metal cation transporter [Nitrospirae bacterium]|nr:divalent metal cation transporter MntH [bacterium BMS3Abin10]GBE37933.1 divalent metal cation transporter MntH [bacterium BMS3Bbin08]HDH50680.1 divalent metal cation transporter [Nitrospirota bacterium]HDK17162.1 divalent metal cation transporter [Nitrospirota bacterium]HDK82359.1 divalent metal cation transporter [Nitrospirota bacterium]
MSRWKSFIILLSVIGPGIITASIDNDASGITTYSVAGARYGYALLWILIPTTVALIVTQEMVARMGVVTGKGLSDLIRENYGVKTTFYMMMVLLIANFGTTVAEFAGWAASMEMFGLSKYFMVPLGAFGVWLLVTRGSYRTVEIVLLGACLLYFGYIFSGIMAGPKWGDVLQSTLVPKIKWEPEFIMLSIAIIGTTITPWMQFYLQSSIAEKGIKKENYKFSKLDVVAGCFITNIVAFFIIVTCATTLFPDGIRINDAKEAAIALTPFAGQHASTLFAVSLANASILGAIIVPLATAYYICEAMGWEAGVNKSFKEAPQFMWIYTALITVSALLVLIPNAPLILLMVLSSVLNGILLPFVLVFAISLVNNRKIMGEYTNSKAYNYISWGTIGVLIVLTTTLLVMVAVPVK